MTASALIRRLSAVDLSDIAARRTELEGEFSNIQDALARGEKRARELRQTLGELREAKHTGEAAANALLKGDDLMQLDADEDRAKSELLLLSQGSRELASRLDAVRASLEELSHEAAVTVSPIVDDQLNELEADIQGHLMALAENYALARTLAQSLRSVRATTLSNSLEQILDPAANRALVPRSINVPAELKDGLAKLEALRLLDRPAPLPTVLLLERAVIPMMMIAPGAKPTGH